MKFSEIIIDFLTLKTLNVIQKKKYFEFFYNQYSADSNWKKKYTNLLNFEDTSESFYRKFKKINFKSESKNFHF